MKNIRLSVAALFLVAVTWTGVSAQAVWDVRNPLTQVNNLNGVRWTGSQFVAAGVSGTIVTSPDGANWTVRNSGAGSSTLYSVTSSGSLIVVVGQTGTIVTSSNGIDWSKPSSGVTNTLNGVTWSGALFVAVGQNGTVLTSSNGSTWTQVAAGVTIQTLNAVTWSGTQFVAVGNNGVVLTSPDGVTWTPASSGTAALYSVTWAGGRFIGVGASVIRASVDGTTWTSVTSGVGTLLGLALGSRLVTVGSGGSIRHSPDGDTWTAASSGTTQSLNSVAWSGTAFVAVGASGTILTSPNGITWTQVSSVLSGMNAMTVRYAAPDTQLVAVGDAGAILTSGDGVVWTKRNSNTTAGLYSVTWTGSSFMAVGAGGILATSPDGITWTTSTIISTTLGPMGFNGVTLWGIASTPTGNYVVAVGQDNSGIGVIAVSTNGGTSWIVPNANSPAALLGVTWTTANTFVAVGSHNGTDNMRRASTPTGTWSVVGAGATTNRLNSVTYTGTQVVAVGENGTVATSTSGTNPWVTQPSGVTSALKSVTWSGSQLVAVGSAGRIISSPTGASWATQTSGTTSNLFSVKWDGRQFAAGGAGGIILTSSPLALPPAPVITEPAASATNVPVNPLFSWGTSSGATSYDVQVSLSATFVDTLIDTTTTGQNILLGPLASSVVYYWRVRANGGSGSSSWSAITSFTVIPAGTSAPVQTSPAQAATDIPISTTLTWNTYTSGTTATSYRVQVSTDSLFGTTLANDSITGTNRLLGGLSYSTIYYWRVRASLASGVTAWSTVRRFTTTAPVPAAPTLATPANNAIGVSFPNATLTWNASAGATTYRLQVSTDASFATTLRDTVVSGASNLVRDLVINGVYYWRVSAQNAAGTSAFSAANTFTTATSAPAAPVLGPPANGALEVSVFTSLSWNASTGAATYHLQLSTTSNFSAIVLQDSTLTGLTFNPGQLGNNISYFWRVRARNPAGVSAWSERNFTTGTAPIAPPPAPVPFSPAQFAQDVSLSPTLQWNAAATAMSYRVQVSVSPVFATLVVNDSLITGTTRAIANLAGSTSYYWRVAATNNIGTGAWSEVMNFNTLHTIPAAPEPIAPEAFATGVSVSPTLSWNVSAGASSYRVQVSTATTFATLVVNDSITATSRAIGPLGGNTDYYWRVNARNAAGISAYSTTRRFTTGALPAPAVPVLLLPAQFDTGVAVTGVTLVWEAASAATSYRVQVSVSPTFANVARDDSGLTTTSRFVGPLLGATDYYWRVSSKNSAGVSAFSGARRFTTTQGTSLLPGGIVMRSMSFGAGRSLRFGLPFAQRVTVRIFDMRGNLVADLLDEPRAAGYHTLALPPSLRGGLYLVDFRAGNTRLTLKTQP